MSKRTPTNFAASAYARLKNIADTTDWTFMHLLVRYATERFLYRLSISPNAKQFVLKGGNLFVIWQEGQNYRPTIDSDLLCFGDAEPYHLEAVFRAVCQTEPSAPDGMIYDVASIETSPIREDSEYGGTRILLNAHLGQARTRLQFDIGIGDAITPAPEMAEYPVLLNTNPAPLLKIYPMATAIAEKTEAMVSRGIVNSRMKDFYDIWLLSELFDHRYTTLAKAIRNTFERRGIQMPTEIPIAWTPVFSTNASKVTQWRAFIRKSKLDSAPSDFSVVIKRIADFLRPACFPPVRLPTKWIAGKGWE